MQKFKERTMRLTVPVFLNYSITIVVSTDLEKSLAKRNLDHLTVGYAMHVFIDNRSYLFFPEDATINSIAHEAWHCIRRIFMWAGVTEFENEVTAYHLGWLTSRVFFFMYKGKKLTVRKDGKAYKVS